MKLISMTDFVLEQTKLYKEDKVSVFDFGLRVEKYAQFLKQPLTLGIFVPCDEEGNVLKEPNKYNFGIWVGEYEKRILIYQKAKERVLFEGFYYQSNFSKKQNKLYEYVRNKNPHLFSFEQVKNNTVESLLVGYKKEFLITLTQTAIKQIGL